MARSRLWVTHASERTAHGLGNYCVHGHRLEYGRSGLTYVQHINVAKVDGRMPRSWHLSAGTTLALPSVSYAHVGASARTCRWCVPLFIDPKGTMHLCMWYGFTPTTRQGTGHPVH